MSRKSKKTTRAKGRNRAPVARKPKAKRPVLVSAREKRIALDQAVEKRLEFLEESVKNLWLMREQMNALSKELGDARMEMSGFSESLANNSQEEADNYMAIQALRNAIGSLAANVHDKLEAMRRGE